MGLGGLRSIAGHRLHKFFSPGVCISATRFLLFFSSAVFDQKKYIENATGTPVCASGLLVGLFKCLISMENPLIGVLGN